MQKAAANSRHGNYPVSDIFQINSKDMSVNGSTFTIIRETHFFYRMILFFTLKNVLAVRNISSFSSLSVLLSQVLRKVQTRTITNFHTLYMNHRQEVRLDKSYNFIIGLVRYRTGKSGVLVQIPSRSWVFVLRLRPRMSCSP